MQTFFSSMNATCKHYLGWRDASNPMACDFRVFVEMLWRQYEPFADPNFLEEAGRDLHSRFWEMCLTCTLLNYASQFGYTVDCPKPGPDVQITRNGTQIWLEAVAATDGDPGMPDSILPPPEGQAHSIPDEKMILRYTTAIQEKIRKYKYYLAKGTVGPDEPYVIAVNAGKFFYRWSDGDMPRFLKALLPIGHLEFILDRRTTDLLDKRNQHRPQVLKMNGSPVSTQSFLDPTNAGISAVLHSYAAPGMTGDNMGGDFFLAHNPLAANPIRKGVLPCVREYWVSLANEQAELHCDEHALTNP